MEKEPKQKGDSQLPEQTVQPIKPQWELTLFNDLYYSSKDTRGRAKRDAAHQFQEKYPDNRLPVAALTSLMRLRKLGPRKTKYGI